MSKHLQMQSQKLIRLPKSPRNEVEAEVNAERTSVEQEIANKIQEAEARITASKEAALDQVNEVASDTTKALIEKLIKIDVSHDDLETAVSSAIKSS